MAPDMNGVGAGGRWDYSTPGAGGYNVADFSLNDPSFRPIKVICIGAGVSGILSAYQIQKYCQNVEFKAFEKNPNIGGTWLENKYPGAACDIPSHAYTYNFALNPDWPRYMALSADIWKYLDLICDTFDLRKKIVVNSEVIGAYWEEDAGQWHVKVRETKDGEEVRTFEETCDFLLHATGVLNNFKFPDIEGINDFKGKVVHTARWPDEYQVEQWKGESVAVIGSGASSIQTVPTMQPHVKHMDVFVRTGVWFVQIAENYGQEQPYSDEQKQKFHQDPSSLVKHAKELEDLVNGVWGGFFSGSKSQKQMHDFFYGRMSEHIKDKKLLDGFTPKFGIGCRRITPGDPYMLSIQKDNVDVHFTHATKLTKDGVIGGDGVERKCDTIICATGFDVSYRPRFPLVGRNGVDLRDKWSVCPEGYMGLAVPDMPNFLTFVGPTWPVENGSVMGPLNGVSEYAVQMIKKLQAENIHSYAPKQDVTDAFNEHAQEWIKHTVWKEDCRSWYRNNETGRVNAIWPGSSLHYLQAIRYPRYEDYEIKYKPLPEGMKGLDGKPAFGKNMFAYLGSGFTLEGRQEGLDAGLDPSPYIQTRYLDPRWLVATGTSPEAAREIVLKATADAARKEKEEDLDREEKGQGGSIYKSVRPRVL